ncbi:arginine biosynthesis ArgJ, mitochondrial [Cryptococcus neoformans c8]|nr:arginine biosynthesis ArgJ, mitochondrial [Cryptococcus neoformans var. grubii AD1-83a]OXG60625.1 arginine biosynthesis ArgJ, mitochondrial [Cryptococcus neoformans var. grubii MW-RSA1955]OXG64112.1 arginine biosynthesis ArgJ, mitochondrial [Cryptococcus neoformans var. grubii c8]OXG65510.1 arginine biosynthesis ArgJ, mitochondrial [Cryptococcus neoformans var. grubii CHC193]OXH11923.1 arginine biosynthesis ArgJ, mitochondrial [Cryptococcus neoformans var. grubii A5-35-17]OXH13243.1 arginin
MPPNIPAPSVVARAIPSLARAASTTTKPKPSKEHHVHSYSPEVLPLGYAVASTHASVKKKAGALDLGILVSTTDKPASAAACLTRNAFKAAPVTVTTELLQSGGGRARGFIVNSGCANAVTGKKGLEDAWEMSNTVTSQLPPGQRGIGTLVMSTGVIGQHLPISSIVSKIPELVRSLDDSPKSWLDLSKSFMTTDSFPKLRAKSFRLGERLVRIAGIDKGAGMIAPSMGPPQPPHATLLGVIATDAAISPSALQSALNYAVDRSFNNITVDGDMSTNDSIICLANGAAGKLDTQGRETAEGMEEITEDGNPEEYKVFREELRSFAEELAQLVVRDGEGATKFVTIRVKNAPSYETAQAVAKSIANSSLFKTAMYGEDANWGRILCAVGYTPTAKAIIPNRVSVSFIPSANIPDSAPLQLLTNGEPEANIDEDRASVILAEEDLEVEVDLGDGHEEAKVWTCDFSHEYVTINGSYRS